LSLTLDPVEGLVDTIVAAFVVVVGSILVLTLVVDTMVELFVVAVGFTLALTLDPVEGLVETIVAAFVVAVGSSLALTLGPVSARIESDWSCVDTCGKSIYFGTHWS
jgi:hypothetical protein